MVMALAAVAGAACTSSVPAAPGPSSAASPAVSATPVLSRDERWAEDIASLVRRMEELHPDLTHGVSSEAIHTAADSLVERVPELSDDQILVGLMGLVAMVSAHGRDGHMGIWPPDNPSAVHRFPLRLWEFPEGLFVTAAMEPHEDLVGSRIVAVNGRSIDEVIARLDPVVPRDNASNLRAARTVFLTSAEVLSGLGLAAERSTLHLDVATPKGGTRSEDVAAVSAEDFAAWVGGWELALPPRPGLRFTQRPNAHSVITYLSGPRALLVQYRVVDEASGDLVEAIRDAMARHPVDRLILDLRANGGGEADGYRELLRFLTSGDVDRPGRLVVLVGRLTFSAGASLTVLLQRRATHAILMGEDTGGAPNIWADTAEVTLPHSRLTALVPTEYFGIGGPDDRRLTVHPDIDARFDADDYFEGRDPVLDAALSWSPG